jgi:hypothetical protein
VLLNWRIFAVVVALFLIGLLLRLAGVARRRVGMWLAERRR